MCQVGILYSWIDLTLPCCFVPLSESYSSTSQYCMISTALSHYACLGTMCLGHLSLCNYSTSSLTEEGPEREEMLLFWQLSYLKYISLDGIGPSFITLWMHDNCMTLKVLLHHESLSAANSVLLYRYACCFSVWYTNQLFSVSVKNP